MKSFKNITYLIAFGGNIGDVLSTFKNVFTELDQIGEIKDISKIYRSKPLPTTTHEKQNSYLNGMLALLSELDPQSLLRSLIQIEQSLGRDRSLSHFWGPRKIDLDIIAADDFLIDNENLKIPHPQMQNRDFVLVPLRDVCPNWMDPASKKSISKLINDLTEDKIFISEALDVDLSAFVKI